MQGMELRVGLLCGAEPLVPVLIGKQREAVVKGGRADPVKDRGARRGRRYFSQGRNDAGAGKLLLGAYGHCSGIEVNVTGHRSLANAISIGTRDEYLGIRILYDMF